MEQLTSFLSSRGILKSCGAHNRKPVSSQSHIDADLLQAHRSGGSIYVCTDALRNFAENFLPQIQVPFMLVSGDSDVPISESLLADPAIAAILGSGHLLGWYAQNLQTKHSKLTALPIGMDYHTMWERPGLWGISAMSSMAQENSLINILAESPEFSQRYLAAYCNWHFAMGRGDRQECFDRIEKSVCFFESNAVPRHSSWMRQSECMFVISPEGAGMDCHRTWEALLLGCIPVVKKNELSTMFSDLPVLVVNDWQEVKRDTLFDYCRTMVECKFDFTPLFRDHWMRRISGIQPMPLEAMTFAEFRKILTRKTG